MKRLLWLALPFLLLAACGHGPPVVGTVIDKQFIAAHDESGWGVVAWVPQTQSYEDCTYSAATKSESCIPMFRTVMTPVYGPTVDHVPDSWYLTVKDINGHTHRVGVSRVAYDIASVGSHFDSRIKVAQ